MKNFDFLLLGLLSAGLIGLFLSLSFLLNNFAYFLASLLTAAVLGMMNLILNLVKVKNIKGSKKRQEANS